MSAERSRQVTAASWQAQANMQPQPIEALTADRAAYLLEWAARGRVAVIGDCMLDRYLEGPVDRISPEAPVPVLRVEAERHALGGAGNVAASVVALGGACRLVSLIGDDPAAGLVRDLLASAGIDADGLVRDRDRPTVEKTRVVARRQQIVRVDKESTAVPAESVRAGVRARAREALEWADTLVLADYDKGTVWPELAAELLGTARDYGKVSVVDPKLRHFFACRGAHLFKPNGRELAKALGLETPPRDTAALQDVRARLDCCHLLMTLGEEGMILVSEDEDEPHAIGVEPREVYDVSGAGDTVTAVLAAVAGSSAPLREIAHLAAEAAAIAVSRAGVVQVGAREIVDELERRARRGAGAIGSFEG